MALVVRPGVEIPDSELEVAFIRSAGPGGQNVNKVASAVQLRFALDRNVSLRADVKTRLRSLAGQRLTDAGEILIAARSHRSQEQNRREAEDRLRDLVLRALVVPKKRVATKPSRASKERRLESKTRSQKTKRLRGRIRSFD
jgi:ribosome-associated protein